MSKPKLISFTVCPFVQRAVLALEEKGVDYDMEFIDLANKPAWFLALSPRGKVPVLVEEGESLFESQAIVEYLDETRGGVRLTPEDPRQRARDRAWFTYASEEIFAASWLMESAKDAAAFEDETAAMRQKLGLVEEALAGREYLSGDGSSFGLADVAYAPALYRFAAWKRLYGVDGAMDGLPRVAAWAERVLARETMPRSVPESWRADGLAMGKRMGTYLSSLAG